MEARADPRRRSSKLLLNAVGCDGATSGCQDAGSAARGIGRATPQLARTRHARRVTRQIGPVCASLMSDDESIVSPRSATRLRLFSAGMLSLVRK